LPCVASSLTLDCKYLGSGVCVAMRQCVAACCSMLPYTAEFKGHWDCNTLQHTATCQYLASGICPSVCVSTHTTADGVCFASRVCVCMCESVFVCVQICTYIYMCVCACLCVCVRVRMYRYVLTSTPRLRTGALVLQCVAVSAVCGSMRLLAGGPLFHVFVNVF